MHIVTVENFLFCFDLETGGYFLGWLGTVFVSLAIVLVVGLGLFSLLVVGDIGEMIKHQNGTDVQVDNWMYRAVLESELLLAVLFAVLVIYLVFYLSANILLIIGTKNRNADKIILYLVMTVIGTLLWISQVATGKIEDIAYVIVGVVINFYIYICVYSLYVRFKDERKYKFPEA